MIKVQFQLEDLSCPSCIKKIENTLNKQSGIDEARVLFHSNKVKATCDETIINADGVRSIIEKLGYTVVK
ncbi:heavy-metal-associated domain-containing protein [Bacillus sp. PS06]|uniref:heavy-metal-associated domain-containing protein n=1 Tax=Bacillus sp. PS06 TaxID=2764176 RepID=UPI0017862993|nr:heavy-metal-associated domain-containing protein [Bacillus sp. PS06]MBD8069817.1 heavy-metal-associated domain-containing protein [Bacillus sp. PS06]